MKRILFLCTGNSCRSQMAEGWATALKGSEYQFFSAGIEKHGLNPNAIKVMAESGIDISGHQSQSLEDFGDLHFDIVFTVCGNAHETCPVFPGRAHKIHVGFDDPPKLAANAATEEEGLQHYRRVRDEIKNFIEKIGEHLPAEVA